MGNSKRREESRYILQHYGTAMPVDSTNNALIAVASRSRQPQMDGGQRQQLENSSWRQICISTFNAQTGGSSGHPKAACPMRGRCWWLDERRVALVNNPRVLAMMSSHLAGRYSSKSGVDPRLRLVEASHENLLGRIRSAVLQ